MAVKRIQDNRNRTYQEFLRGIGAPCDDISVLGFHFPGESAVFRYHFDLMANKIKVVLFDHIGDRAVVCLPAGYVEMARSLSEVSGGIEFSVLTMLYIK